MTDKCRVKIDVRALLENAFEIRKCVGDFFCVLKCDAYGHGLDRCAGALYGAGFDRFAVYSIEEAMRIRGNAPESEILVLGRTEPKYASVLSEHRLIQSVFSEEYAGELARTKERIRVHIKLDSGMNRTGFKCDSQGVKNSFLGFTGEVEGVYTHFYSADSRELLDTVYQLDRFQSCAKELDSLFGRNLVKHAAASAGALRLKEARLDISRIGLALYGISPDNCQNICALKPVMSFLGTVIAVKSVKKGENIGYGGDFLVKRDTVVATVSAGYANGLPRAVNHSFKPLVRGVRVPFLGRICMDRCMLDVTELALSGISVLPYDEVCFFGQGLSVTELSDYEGTIPYETLVRVGKMNTKCFLK